MLTKIVVKLYAVILEVGLWLILLVGLVGGWQANGFFGGVLGVIFSAILGAVFFGAFLVLEDIRATVKEIKEKF